MILAPDPVRLIRDERLARLDSAVTILNTLSLLGEDGEDVGWAVRVELALLVHGLLQGSLAAGADGLDVLACEGGLGFGTHVERGGVVEFSFEF